MTGYMLKKRLAGQKHFPLVLMLEPLVACNLHCSGCGRIREYADDVHRTLSLDECLDAAEECGAPVVSICGGEPLIYPKIEELIARLIARRKHVYLCTNGLFLEKKLPGLRPSSRLAINVHLDGMEATHDRIVERSGVFHEAVAGIQAAKRHGFRVCTNTTVYRQTEMHEIVVLLEYLTTLGVDGFLVSPAYGYEAVHEANQHADRLFPHARRSSGQVPRCPPIARTVPAYRVADLSRFSVRPAGTLLRGLGQSDAHRPRLEGAVLSGDRHPLRELPRVGQFDRLEQARSRP